MNRLKLRSNEIAEEKDSAIFLSPSVGANASQDKSTNTVQPALGDSFLKEGPMTHTKLPDKDYLKLPWKAVPYDDGYIRGKDNNVICMISSLEQRDLIVLAVNNHEQLVEVAKSVIENLERDLASGNFVGDDEHELLGLAKQALANAEKEE